MIYIYYRIKQRPIWLVIIVVVKNTIYEKASEFKLNKTTSKAPIRSEARNNANIVVDLYKNGDSITRIAEKFKTCRATIRKILIENNIYGSKR